MKTPFDIVMAELEALGKERQKKYYISQGAKEPLFGVATGAMKSIMKKTGKDQALADRLYATGNYDAMYFAGMIAEPTTMTKDDFNRWMESAYFYMISDYIVAVTLAESALAQEIADEWIIDGRELYQSAGWSCYEWLLGSRPDQEFSQDKLHSMLKIVEEAIHTRTDRVRYAMNNFLIAVGVSYLPLHEEAQNVAAKIGVVEISKGKANCALQIASESIQSAVQKGKLGFKRRNVRC